MGRSPYDTAFSGETVKQLVPEMRLLKSCCCNTLSDGCALIAGFFGALSIVGIVLAIDRGDHDDNDLIDVIPPSVALLINIVLLYGAKARKAPVVLVAFICYVIQFCLSIAGIVWLILHIEGLDGLERTRKIIMWLLASCLVLSLPVQAYLNLVIYSFYKQLVARKQRRDEQTSLNETQVINVVQYVRPLDAIKE